MRFRDRVRLSRQPVVMYEILPPRRESLRESRWKEVLGFRSSL